MSVTLPSAKTTHPLLAAYLAELAGHPLRTKAVTSAILCFFQETLASHLAGVPIQRPPKDAPTIAHALAKAKIDSKTLKMAAYGMFVSAPLGHLLVGRLQRAFVGKTGTRWKIAQILSSNLLVAPIQTTVYLASMAIINGSKSLDDIIRTVKGGFLAVIRITWIISPLSMVIAQKFISPELWVPFFNMVSFVIGTYFTTRVKKMRLAAEAKARKEKQDGKDK